MENCNTPTRSSLTDQDRDFVLRIFEDLKIIIATLGYPIFEHAKRSETSLYYCTGEKTEAVGEYTEEGFVVNKESKFSIEEKPTLNDSRKLIRMNLLEKGILKKEGDVYVLQEDFTFLSPSASASIVLGKKVNGWNEWKDKDGKTLDEVVRHKNKEE